MSQARAVPVGHAEPHGGGMATRLNWVRAAVLGANDGIVSTAGSSGPTWFTKTTGTPSARAYRTGSPVIRRCCAATSVSLTNPAARAGSATRAATRSGRPAAHA